MHLSLFSNNEQQQPSLITFDQSQYLATLELLQQYSSPPTPPMQQQAPPQQQTTAAAHEEEESYFPMDYFFLSEEETLSNLVQDLIDEPHQEEEDDCSAGSSSSTTMISVMNDEFIDSQEEEEEQQVQKLNVSDVIDGLFDQDNGWKVIKSDSNVINSEDCGTRIVLSSRKFSSSEKIDAELYSCVTYEMRHEAYGSFVRNAAEKHRVLLVRVEVIDPSTNQVVLKNGKTILNGCTEGAISKLNHSDIWRYDMKIKFNSCSYHFSKTSFCFRVSYFFENMEEPFLVKQSSDFMIYARVKKQEKKPASEKRKRSYSSEEETEENMNKRTCVRQQQEPLTQQSSELKSFSEKLQALLNEVSHMSGQDRKIALDMIQGHVRANF